VAKQFRERPAIIDAGGVWLEGLYAHGADTPAVLICGPVSDAPGMGMDAPPVAELAFASWMRQMPSLRFQHRGIGASTGAADASAAIEDAERALEHLRDSTGQLFVIASYFTGAHTALAVAAKHPHCRKVAMLAPPDEVEVPEQMPPLMVMLTGEATSAPRWSDVAEVQVAATPDDRFLNGLAQACLQTADWLKAPRRR